MAAITHDRGVTVRQAIAALEQADCGSRSLDCMIAHAMDLHRGEFDQIIMEEMRSEGYAWDTIADLWGDRLQRYTTSLDQAVTGENVVCVIRSAQKGKWAAVHRSATGEETLAWGATEALARRLAGLKALTQAIVAPRYPHQDKAITIPRGSAAPLRRDKVADDLDMPALSEAAEGPEEGAWSILF